MRIEDIKQLNRDVLKLETIQKQISVLEKNEEVGGITISKYNRYEVNISDEEFGKTIRVLALDKLRRDAQKLIKHIEEK